MAAQGPTRPYQGDLAAEGGVVGGATAIAIIVQLDDIDIIILFFSFAEGGGVAGDGVAAIGGLNEGEAPGIVFSVFSADGFGPLEVSVGIQLDDIDILFSCAEGVGLTGDGVAAIGGLNKGAAYFIIWSADSLTEVGGGSDGGDGIRGRGCSDLRTLRWQRSGDKKR